MQPLQPEQLRTLAHGQLGGKKYNLISGRIQVTEPMLCGWLGQAVKGDVLAYHRGSLVHDLDTKMSKLPDAERRELDRVTRRAFLAFASGLVELVQCRHGPDDYSYLMIARTRSSKSEASLAAFIQGTVQ